MICFGRADKETALRLRSFGGARLLANFFEIGGGVGARGQAETMFHCKRRMQLRRSQLPIDALRDVKKAGHVSFVRRLQRPRH